jgi:hypothetical protein
VIGWREGRVVELVREWDGTAEYVVDVHDPAGEQSTRCRALAYPALVGRPEVGDLVLLNTAALEAGLGTGGHALVVALPNRLPVTEPSTQGHLVKARYTPLQVMVQGVDEQQSVHHDLLRDADDLLGLPVVVADLHSALPAVLAGLRAERDGLRVAYVMTDGACLPAWYSRTVSELRAAGWLQSCITVGQAFGGDLEAVSVHTGLLAARYVVAADVVVVAQGPGNLGSGTRWGFSGVAAGEAVNAVATLRGRPVACLRVSQADPRSRHQGLSHHSRTAFGRVALAAADLAVPMLPGDFGALVRTQAGELAAPAGRHRVVEVELDGLEQALVACPVRLSSMGRGLDQDLAPFLAAAAAGRHAARLAAQT